MKKMLFLLVCLVFLFVSSFSSLAQVPQKGGILKGMRGSFPRCLGYPPDMVPIDNIFALLYAERLVAWGPWEKAGEFVPVLAESWKIDEKAKTITVALKKGIKFHDGTPFNAEAVKWNYEMRMEFGRVPEQEFIKSIDVVNEYTVRFNLTELFSTAVLSYLQGVTFYSPTSIKTYGKEWARTHAYGTGPFKLADFQRDTLVKYVKNENYWRQGYPLLDGVEIRFIPDTVTAAMMMEKGDADIWLDVGDVKRVLDLQAKGFKVNWGPGFAWAILPDSLDPNSPFSNKKVREALEYALDKVAIAKAIGFGKYEPLSQIVPSMSVAYNAGYTPRPYNPQKAKQLLAEAGYPNGFEVNLLVRFTEQDAATAIKSYLDAVGIRINIDLADLGRYNAALYTKEGWKGLAFGMYGINPDGTETLVHFGPRTRTLRYARFQKSKEFIDLCEKALRTLNVKEMQKLLRQAVKQAADDVMVIPVYRSTQAIVMQPYVYSDYGKIHVIEWPSAYKDWIQTQKK